MLASLPTHSHGVVLYEPKWDGFRAIVFRSGSEPLHPEPRLRRSILLSQVTRTSQSSTDGSVVDGEIVIATSRGLDFDALQMRCTRRHPCREAAKGIPASCRL